MVSSLKGEPIDLRKVEMPVYIMAAREDHIAPWQNTYAAAHLYAGPERSFSRAPATSPV